MFSRKRGVRFGEKIVPKFISLQSLLELLYNDLTIDYTLLMPILLFLPCYTSSEEMIKILTTDFQKLSMMTTKDSVRSRMNILIILRCWLRETFAHADFNHENIIKLVENFLSGLLDSDVPALSAAASKIQEQFRRIVDEFQAADSCLEYYSNELSRASTEPPPEIPTKTDTESLSESRASATEAYFSTTDASHKPLPLRDITMKFPYTDIADMLTILELEDGILTIRPRELVGMRWTQQGLKTLHPDLGGSSHLTRLILATNQRIAWIADEIIHRGTIQGSIAECIEYFLRVARRALRMNNFNTVFQIVSALNLPAIKHLGSAWGGISSHKKGLYATYNQLCDPSQNYANYRRAFAAVRGQARIPCIQVLLRDIVLMETASPWLENEQINMQKLESLFRLLNLNIFSTTVSTLSPVYSITLTTASQVVSHESGSTFISSNGLEYTGFFISCITLQESLFFSRRQRHPDGVIIHENIFGSYARIASELMEAYLQREAEEVEEESSSLLYLPGVLLSLFSTSTAPTSHPHEALVQSQELPGGGSSDNKSHFVISAVDHNLIGLISAIRRTNTDLNVLWENSKVADDIENSRLMHRLIRAGLA